MSEPNYIRTGATFSPCKRYRYTLLREWSSLSDKEGYVLFIMLNPSTADEYQLDPTVRRCLGYAMDWGYRKMHVANIFALRSTDPKHLYDSVEFNGEKYVPTDPVGIDNNKCICTEVENADLVIAAWGSHGIYKNRGKDVMDMISKIKDIYYLKLTKGNVPGHPLYLKGNLVPQKWSDKL
jgi:hypothetical protein